MAEINTFDVWFNGITSSVSKAIAGWTPGTLTSEKQYRDSLFAELRVTFPKAKIEREYRDTGTTADICLIWNGILTVTKIYIELKYNLTKKTEYNRLLGQIMDMAPRENKIFVVLCGHTDIEFSERLRAHLTEYTEPSMPYSGVNMEIINK